jgi:HAD superfamily phosphatase (TIGR01668 family)
MQKNGISLMVLSNAKTHRAQKFAQRVGLPVLGMAAKPLPFGYIKAVKLLGKNRKNVAMVGDQVFTDVLGGKLSGIKTILVTNITPEDKIGFKIKRYFESIMLKRWKYER